MSARSNSYGVAATKACLVKKGASLQKPVPGSPSGGLSAAQQAQVIIGTVPAGGEPAFLYLAIGRNAADALAIRKALTTSMAIGTLWSDARQNAAWTIVSLSGSPDAAVRNLVLSCLTTGTAPTGAPPPAPTTYDAHTVAVCVENKGLGDATSQSQLKLLLKRAFGGSVPASVLPHVLLLFTSTSPSTNDGLGIFILFGKTQHEAVTLRTSLVRALKLTATGSWQATKKNIAWYGFSHRGTTAAGAAAGKSALLGCLP